MDALEQVYRNHDFLEILDFLENFNSGIKGNGNMSDLSDHAELEHEIDQPNEYWNNISKDLNSMLLKLCEPKSQGFLITKSRKHPVRLHSNPFVAGRGSQRFGSFAVPVRAVPVRPVRTV